jgi:hypothetical protein
MSDQLPPIDQDLRAHLTRRSAGRLPEGLADQVLQAVDVAPVKPRYAWRAFSPRSGRAAPRTLLAGASVAAVLLLAAALVVVPRFQVTPAASGLAGYPADRALTTAELASLMAGPALPTNTALVANAVIDIRSDVCPMDRYRTVGIVEGMASQVCVMTASDVLIQPFAIRGVFAFRYLGPGVLGLIGEITPASAQMAFRVADEWPLAGKTFLVEGWLGAEGLLESCAQAPTSGDVLLPNGEDCPYNDWLSDDSTAPGIQADHEYSPQSPLPSHDPLSLRGNARHVEAGGMRLIDSLDPAAPVHGVYVVRSVTEGCPGDPPQSSRGCGAWRVLAKVADVPAPVATPVQTPSPTLPAATPPTGYPVDRALTAAELASVMAGPALPVNTTLVAAVTIDSSESGAPGCVPTVDYSTIGLVHGMPTRICVFGDGFSPARVPGVFAFRYLGPGALYLMAQITPASSSRLAFHATEAWPWGMAAYITFLAGGYLERGPTGARIVDILNGPTPPSFLSSQTLLVDPTAGLDSIDPSQYGVFVVTAEWVSVPASSMGPSGDGIAYHVIAQVGDIALPGASATPPPSPTPTTAPPATPLAPSLTGVIGTANQPFTADELETLMVSRPDHLAGRIVIVEAPIPTQISCQSDANGGGCAVNTAPLAGDGVWAVSIGTDGTLSLVGKVTVPQSGFVFTFGQAVATWSKAGTEKQFFVVDAWLGGAGEDSCDVVGAPCYEVSWLGSTAGAQEVAVPLGAYHQFGGGPVGGGAAIHGIFLVEWVPATTDCGTGQDTGSGPCSARAVVVARLETGTVP